MEILFGKSTYLRWCSIKFVNTLSKYDKVMKSSYVTVVISKRARRKHKTIFYSWYFFSFLLKFDNEKLFHNENKSVYHKIESIRPSTFNVWEVLRNFIQYNEFLSLTIICILKRFNDSKLRLQHTSPLWKYMKLLRFLLVLQLLHLH